jgi:Zn-dependent M28 family amino/carboxypeptidase
MLLAFIVGLTLQQAPIASAAACAGQRSAPPAVDAAQLMRDVSVLAADSMEGRELGTPGGAKARRYLVTRIRGLGLDTIGPLVDRRRDTVLTGANLVATVRGTVQPDRYVVVSAHYDHIGVRRGEVFNGADDNASGTAALLALAAHFRAHRPRHSLLLVWFDGEEHGLEGATHFLAAPPVAHDAMAVDVNMDMVGRNVRNQLFAVGPLKRPALADYVRRAACRTPVTLMLGHDKGWSPAEDWTDQSDQGAFDARGIPFIYLGEEDHPDYHRPSDDVERLQPAFLAGAAQAAIALVEAIDADPGALGRPR